MPSLTIPAIGAFQNGERGALDFGDVREPSNDLCRSVEVAARDEMGNTDLAHDLGTTELMVRGVHFATEDLAKGRGSGKDDRLAFDLN